ncbi:MAG: hypothetical protein M3285_07625 [Actinomycetota bacterium]|nr:hypothetical protein [Actinomycetota bacterium]MDQ3955402.1 hypothetical protein [Actinomycetota bacterium]
MAVGTIVRKVVVSAVSLALLGPPAIAQPPREGNVLLPAPGAGAAGECSPDHARATYLASGGSVESPFGSAIPLDRSEWNGEFSLDLVRGATGDEDLDVHFFGGDAAATEAVHAFERRGHGGEEGVVPPGVEHAIVCLSPGSGVDADWTYDARPPEPRSHTRPCTSSVSGDAGDGWKENSVISGPLAFVNVRPYESSNPKGFRRYEHGYRSTKALVAVRNGAAAMVSVPESHRRRTAMLYDRDRFGRRGYELSDGHVTVSFLACSDGDDRTSGGWTQFNGGFVLTQSGCLPLEVRTPGRAGVRRAVLSFGAGRCD